jgi:hypothetical protein
MITIGNVVSCDEILLSPILEHGEIRISGFLAIFDYLENIVSINSHADKFKPVDRKLTIASNVTPSNCRDFFHKDSLTRAKSLMLCDLFNNYFFNSAEYPLIFEKVIKLHQEKRAPDTQVMAKARVQNISYLSEMDKMCGSGYLLGDRVSLADLCISAHISCLDYLGEVKWSNLQNLQTFYSLIKSRPSFKNILFDRIPSVGPPKNYSLLDF